METIEDLRHQKRILLMELKTTKVASRKEEIIDKVLEIEQKIARIIWETSPKAVSVSPAGRIV